MKRTILLLAILLVACSPFVPQTPQEQPQPTAFIDPTYPTMESAPLTVMQESGGIDISADRAWRDGKQVNVDVGRMSQSGLWIMRVTRFRPASACSGGSK